MYSQSKGRTPSVFVFNPFTEGYLAQGKGFTPVKHQARLAEDLANLPQFLGRADDVVLVPQRPSVEFLGRLKEAGFALPEFVELGKGSDLLGLCERKISRLRPWAWGPDSIELFQPLFAHVAGEARSAAQRFNEGIARLYSKAWSAAFLRKVLAHFGGVEAALPPEAEKPGRLTRSAMESWLCAEPEVGVAVDTLESALEAVAGIRGRGHHRVVAKAAHGLAGQNAIRLWEPELLPTQRQWLAHVLRDGRQVVIEPWLERELDFSVQLEMEPEQLKVCGYTGLINDANGRYQGNWAAANYSWRLPAKVTALFQAPADIADRLQRFYNDIFALLEAELKQVGFVGPVSLDAFVYRPPGGGCRLKPVVEINPRYTMGRVTVELMKQACPGSCGVFRLVSRAQARAEGCADFSDYARSQRVRSPLRLEGEPKPRIREGWVCLNDPAKAQVCLATFEVSRTLR